MIDTTFVAFGYAFIAVAGIAIVAGLAAIAAVVRDARSTSTPYVLTVSGPSDADVRRAA